MTVGVLAVQGDFPEHKAAIARAAPRIQVVLVRTPRELAHVDRLFLPGGESTAIAGLITRNGLREPLRRRLEEGLPTLATCAGLILLARRLTPGAGGRDPPTFGLLDVTVRRNDYGGQRESFEAPLRVAGLSGGPFPGVFIRAPRIVEVGPGATPIAWLGDEVVGVREGNLWGLTFHPELALDARLIAAFLAAAGPPAHQMKNKATTTRSRTTPAPTASR
jgi:5'-phosphate synthase pdxT subunit